ncbi:hypothetical protein D9M68_564310 [compost metagenome]
MILAGEHQIGHQQGHAQRQRHVQPPEPMGQGEHAFAPVRHAEQHQAVDQGGQPHGNGAEEHRLHRVQQHRPQGVAEHQDARDEQQGETGEEDGIEQPEDFAQAPLQRPAPGQRRDHQCQRAGAHGHGEPVGCELADEGEGFGKAGKGARHIEGSGRVVP